VRLVITKRREEPASRAGRVIMGKGVARPILIARAAVSERWLQWSRLRSRAGTEFDRTDPQFDPHFALAGKLTIGARRPGVTARLAKIEFCRRDSPFDQALLRIAA
jgi:hypothetical protein